MEITLAVKCAPQKEILEDVQRAGIEAVELFLSEKFLQDVQKSISICKQFPFKYALHSPNDVFKPKVLLELAHNLDVRTIVFHDILWDDEWKAVFETFKPFKGKLCVENVTNAYEASKFVRRYGFGRCVDLEHIQLECNGVYEDALLSLINQASHIHLTGYVFGSKLWHTPINFSPEHNKYMLDLIKKANYSGFVVSEAQASWQTYEHFKGVHDFFRSWSEVSL